MTDTGRTPSADPPPSVADAYSAGSPSSSDEPQLPELAGVGEAAAILGVTKQRVHQLARTDRFPPPVAILKATPVWLASDLRDFQAGRAKKSCGCKGKTHTWECIKARRPVTASRTEKSSHPDAMAVSAPTDLTPPARTPS